MMAYVFLLSVFLLSSLNLSCAKLNGFIISPEIKVLLQRLKSAKDDAVEFTSEELAEIDEILQTHGQAPESNSTQVVPEQGNPANQVAQALVANHVANGQTTLTENSQEQNNQANKPVPAFVPVMLDKQQILDEVFKMKGLSQDAMQKIDELVLSTLTEACNLVNDFRKPTERGGSKVPDHVKSAQLLKTIADSLKLIGFPNMFISMGMKAAGITSQKLTETKQTLYDLVCQVEGVQNETKVLFEALKTKNQKLFNQTLNDITKKQVAYQCVQDIVLALAKKDK